jgi:hypothetical protein
MYIPLNSSHSLNMMDECGDHEDLFHRDPTTRNSSLGEISGSRGDENKYHCILGCCAM